ncbi:MAG: DUF5011 domain-containing protein [Chitinophagales bacterium]
MFRALLLTLLVGSCLSVNAQTQAPSTTTKADIYSVLTTPFPAKYKVTTGNELNSTTTRPASGDYVPQKSGVGTIIGTTTYDLQTNYGMCRRIVVSGDNVYAAWTGSETGDVAAPDRGTFLNMSNDGGDTWMSLEAANIRRESQRVGWPNLGVVESGANQGRLFSITHSGADGLNFAYLDAGSTEWQDAIIPGDADAVWPRAAVDGENIHVITSRNGTFGCGADGGLAYFRSQDGGDTWEGPICVADATSGLGLGEIDDDASLRADSYFIDAKDGVVAFAYGNFGEDLVVFKSTNGGDTWAAIIAQSVDVDPEGDGSTILESAVTSGGGISLLIDGGEVNLWYERIFNADANSSYIVNSTCIMHWKESFGTNGSKVIGPTVLQDYDGDMIATVDTQNEEFQIYGNTLLGQTSAGIDANGTYYVAYSSVRDGAFENAAREYRDIYVISSNDGGATWMGPFRISDSATTEDVYPSIQRDVKDVLHLVWQSDALTGTAVQEDQAEFTTNEITYLKIPVGDVMGMAPRNNTTPIIFPYLGGFLPNPLEGCEGVIERFDTHVLDFPDGDLTDDIVISNTFDINVAGSEGYWILTVTDSDGNTIEDIPLDANGDPILQQVLADSGPPTIFLEPLLEINGGLYSLGFFEEIDVVAGSEYVDSGAISQDDGDFFGCPSSVTVDNPVDTANPTPVDQPFQVVYTATDHLGKSASLTRLVNVIGIDAEAPFIQLLTARADSIQEDGAVYEIEVEVGGVWQEPGFIALDNVDLVMTDDVVIGGDTVDLENVGTYIVTYTATDNAGNSASVTRQVVVRDGTAPTVGLIGPVPVVVPCNGNYFEFGANAFDAVDGTLQVEVGGDCVCTTTAGSYIVTYTATDASGNTTTESRLVIVQGNCAEDCSTNPASPCFVDAINDNYELYQAITMRPNPTNGLLTIDIEGVNVSGANVEVFNLVGELIHTETMQSSTLSIDLASQAAGMYVVKVNTAEGAIAKKIVLEK